MSSSRSTLRTFALLLALTGVLFRGLIPAGFMPALGADASGGAVLVLCSGGALKSAAAATDPHGHPAAQAMDDCPFAAASSPALPPALASLLPVLQADVEPIRQGEAARPSSHRHPLPPARGPPRIA
jgi:hypothetical protein